MPGPYTLAGRLEGDRWADAPKHSLPIVQAELVALAEAGCEEIAIDEPSMSCYAHREDPERLVELFNRTVTPGRRPGAALDAPLLRQLQGPRGRAAAATRRSSRRSSSVAVDEIHLEMASRELAEAEIVGTIAEAKDVAVGVIDVKSYYVETPEDVADAGPALPRASRRPSGSRSRPTAGSARQLAGRRRRSCTNLVEGVRIVREELGL